MKRYIMMALAIHCTIGCSDPAQEINEADSRMAVPVPVDTRSMDMGTPTNITENREECDGLDNDEDGQIDESGCSCVDEAACYGGPIETRNVGLCSDGVLVCDQLNEFIVGCTGDVHPDDEVCDGLDQDCDGVVDESCCDADDSCESVDETFTVDEETVVRPTDFVMVVDNSGSMNDTAAAVRANLGDFSGRLVAAGIDYTFTVIAAKGTSGTNICVQPPMGGPNCSNADRFRHIDKDVGSHSALKDLKRHYEQGLDGVDPANEYKSMLRPGALLQFIAVTDDEARMTWPEFRASAVWNDYPDALFHAVVGLNDGGCVADVGQQYIQGAEETGGTQLSVCDADWGHVLDVILDTTLQFLTASFELAFSPIPETIRVYQDPGRVAVEDGWAYIEETNMIQFEADAIPPAGTMIHVEYDRRL